MKRFKIFTILYYGFMFVIGILLCFMLPSYNQYNALTKAIKSDIKHEEYEKIPGFFSSFYNETAVVKQEMSNKSLMVVFEASNYNKINDASNYSFAQNAYIGFVFGVDGFKYEDITNEDGEKVNNSAVVYKNQSGTAYKQELDETYTYYMDELDFIYFEINQLEFTNSPISTINSIEILNSNGTSYASTNLTSSLDFNTSFFNQSISYVNIYNESFTNRDLTLTGKFDYLTSKTIAHQGATITYEAPVNGVLAFDGLTNATIENATKIAKADKTTDKENEYTLKTSKKLTITFNEDTDLSNLEFIYGDVTVTYAFDNNEYSGTVYTLEESVTTTKTLGIPYDEAAQKTRYDSWLETYTFQKTDYKKVLKGTTPKTVFQIILYIIIILIIGDFLVGKHRIIYLFQRLFGKKPNEKKEAEAAPEINKYEVMVNCEVHVPLGYSKPVIIKYAKDEQVMEFFLNPENDYKASGRYENGSYKFIDAEASGAHPIRPNQTINVRGFKFELVMNFALDEGITPEVEEINENK